MAKKHSKALLTLTSAAMMLPGVSPQSLADTAPDKTLLSYRYSDYQEDDQPVIGGDVERYEIDVHQLRIQTPIGQNYALNVELQRELMSGASPRLVARPGGDANSDPVVIMSGASIKDERNDAIVTARRYADWGNAAVTAGYSDEDDYESVSIGFDGAYNLDNRLQTLSAGFSFADDDISPTQGVFPPNTLSDDKQTVSVYGGFSQVIDKWSIAQVGVSYTRHSGYLTDPYKKFDERPDQRDQWTLTTRYRHFFDRPNASLHADYRFYTDDWSVISHTLNVAWYQNINDRLTLVPSLRYYTQKQAEFFNQTDPDTTQDRYVSSDYRLSGYGAWSFRIKAIASVENWRFILSAERYRSDAGWGLFNDDDASPALVDFTRYTLGFDYEFD